MKRKTQAPKVKVPLWQKKSETTRSLVPRKRVKRQTLPGKKKNDKLSNLRSKTILRRVPSSSVPRHD